MRQGLTLEDVAGRARIDLSTLSRLDPLLRHIRPIIPEYYRLPRTLSTSVLALRSAAVGLRLPKRGRDDRVHVELGGPLAVCLPPRVGDDLAAPGELLTTWWPDLRDDRGGPAPQRTLRG
jgi:hypothetical protein